MITQERLKSIYERNSFKIDITTPHVVVFRNTDTRGDFVKDTGDNICDTILLVDADEIEVLPGRSYPHIKYQKQQLAGQGACNYIASGYYPYAWRRGWHRGFQALVQNQSFTIWRSRDLELGDDDDYVQNGIVADNFHGYAPASAGCVTVTGKMNPPEGAWKKAYEWAYERHARTKIFAVIIMQNDDLSVKSSSLRIGSQGVLVGEVQRKLGIRDDDDFGPMTFESIRKFQAKVGLFPNGICTQTTLDELRLQVA